MRNKEYYMALNYVRMIQEVNDESGHYFFGKILELDGCQSDGQTYEELSANLTEALEMYIETSLEKGIPIPEPIDLATFKLDSNR